MTRPEILARIRELVRETKHLRKQLRGPRAKAAKMTRDAERRRRVEAICNAWIKIKQAVQERAGGRCECLDTGGRCERQGTECDHFFGGVGRRRQQQSVEGVWLLCHLCHRDKTANVPYRDYWVDSFERHARAHGLKSQLPLVAAERSRIEGKERP